MITASIILALSATCSDISMPDNCATFYEERVNYDGKYDLATDISQLPVTLGSVNDEPLVYECNGRIYKYMKLISAFHSRIAKAVSGYSLVNYWKRIRSRLFDSITKTECDNTTQLLIIILIIL